MTSKGGLIGEVWLTEKEFKGLLEYSTTLPSGTTFGKRWKRNANAIYRGKKPPDWVMGEYYELKGLTGRDDVGIHWAKIRIIGRDRKDDQPKPSRPKWTPEED